PSRRTARQRRSVGDFMHAFPRTTPCLRALAVAAALPVAAAMAHPAQGTLYYTRNCGGVNVRKADYNYDGTTFTLAAPVDVVTVNGADGIIFAPDGDIIVGGQGPQVLKIHLNPFTIQTGTCPGVQVCHVMLDPSGTKFWGASCCPGSDLAEYPLNPFGPC